MFPFLLNFSALLANEMKLFTYQEKCWTRNNLYFEFDIYNIANFYVPENSESWFLFLLRIWLINWAIPWVNGFISAVSKLLLMDLWGPIVHCFMRWDWHLNFFTFNIFWWTKTWMPFLWSPESNDVKCGSWKIAVCSNSAMLQRHYSVYLTTLCTK
jgi:hypothetical protein